MAAGATQRHRLALLALLATRGDRGRSREQVLALLWPERDTTHARQLLNQAVYSLRKALGEGALHSAGDDLRLNSAVVRADAAEFEAALTRGSHDAAAALYRGPFLDAFVLPEAPEFERWAALERDRLAAGYARALEALAAGAEARGDAGSAVGWWRARAVHDPYDSRIAIRLMRALEADGNPGGALQHAGVHAALLQAELGVQPTPEVSALAERLRRDAAVHPPGSPSAPLDDARRLAIPTSTSLANGAAAPDAGRSGPPGLAAGGKIAPSTVGVLAPATPMARATVRASAPTPATTLAAPWRLSRPGRYAALAVCAAVVAFWLGLTRRRQEATEAQHEFARVVGRELDLRLGSPGRAPLGRPRTQSVAAYDLYRRGSDRARLRSDSAAREGVELLRQAVALDSVYAPAWAALAKMHHRVGVLLPPRIREGHHRLAQEAARKAVVLDDSLAEAHGALGMLRMVAFDFAAAERHLTRAVTLDPTRAETHESMVTLYLWTGRPAEALAHAERAVALDPLSPAAHAEVARALLAHDRCDEALAELAKLATLRPPLLRAGDIAAQCYGRQRMWPAAIAVLKSQAERGDPTALAQTAFMLARAGRRGEALGIRATLLDRWRRGLDGTFQIGLVDAGLGELDQALGWFERAVDDRSLHGGPSGPAHLMLVLPGPLSDDLRRHPGFEHLAERLGLPRR